MATTNPTYFVYKNEISVVRIFDSDKTEEEMQLEAELRAITEKRKEMTEEMRVITREADERLRNIKEDEERKKERLLQIRTERHMACFGSQKKAAEQLELEALKMENNQLKQQVAGLTKESATAAEKLESLSQKYADEKREKGTVIQDLMHRIKCLEDVIQQHEQDKLQFIEFGRDAELQTELEVLRTQNQHQSKSLSELKANLQRITSLSRAQQVTIKEDKITAGQQMAVETQLRQLNELHSLTEETRQLKQTLTTLHQHQQQQQQKLAAEERHQGKRCSSLLT